MNFYKNLSPRAKNIIITVGLIVIVSIFYIVRGGGTSIEPNVGDDTFGVIVTEKKETVFSFDIKYSDVETIQLVEVEDLGECLDGDNGKTYSYGTFKNDTYGEYQLAGLTKLSTYIEIHTVDGKYYLCNFESKDTTTEYCSSLNEYVAEKNNS